MNRLFFLFIISLFASNLWGQSITTHISTDSLTVGDTFTYSITANYRTSEFSVVYPDANVFNDPFEVLSIQRFRGRTAQDSIVYRIQYFGVKDTLLTSKPVFFIAGSDSSILQTVALPIYFKSNLMGDDSELRPFKSIFLFAPPWLMWVIILIAMLTAVYLLWSYYKKNKMSNYKTPSQEKVEIPPFISPLYVYEKKLRELKDTGNYKHDNYVNLHIQLSNSIRNYYEDVYKILALESTTREITTSLKKHQIDESIIELNNEILRRCDLIKFAKFKASLHDVVVLLDKAEKLRDLFRHFDEVRLKSIRTDYEIRHGLRNESIVDNKEKEPHVINPNNI
jgi:hypothetical protein